MNATWQTKTQCRGCAAQVLVTLDAGKFDAGLAVFYCPACGERQQMEHPAGYDPLSVSATQAPA
jgi:transcription elongation factor Elf1